MGQLLSTAEAARKMGVSRQAVYLAIEKKRLKAFKEHTNNFRWLIDEDAIDEYRKTLFSRDLSQFNGEPLYDIRNGVYSVRLAAEYLKIKYSTLYYYIRKGHIEAKRKGAAWILMKDELDFLRKQLDELDKMP
jgi:excisionase family DNA binding protein